MIWPKNRFLSNRSISKWRNVSNCWNGFKALTAFVIVKPFSLPHLLAACGHDTFKAYISNTKSFQIWTKVVPNIGAKKMQRWPNIHFFPINPLKNTLPPWFMYISKCALLTTTLSVTWCQPWLTRRCLIFEENAQTTTSFILLSDTFLSQSFLDLTNMLSLRFKQNV